MGNIVLEKTTLWSIKDGNIYRLVVTNPAIDNLFSTWSRFSTSLLYLIVITVLLGITTSVESHASFSRAPKASRAANLVV